jgi:hypothetical protein
MFGELEDGKSVNAVGPARFHTQQSNSNFCFFLQKKSNRAIVKRVSFPLDSNGDLPRTAGGQRDNPVLSILKDLEHDCAPEQGYAVMRPAFWGELPSELWWHVLKYLTRSEGRAASSSCKLLRNVVTSPDFIWAPSKLHLALDSAQEAVRYVHFYISLWMWTSDNSFTDLTRAHTFQSTFRRSDLKRRSRSEDPDGMTLFFSGILRLASVIARSGEMSGATYTFR